MVNFSVIMFISLVAMIASIVLSTFPIRKMARQSFWKSLDSDNPDRVFFEPTHELLMLVLAGGICCGLPGLVFSVMSIPADNPALKLGFIVLFWIAGIAVSFLLYEQAAMSEEKRYIDEWYALHPNVPRPKK